MMCLRVWHRMSRMFLSIININCMPTNGNRTGEKVRAERETVEMCKDASSFCAFTLINVLRWWINVTQTLFCISQSCRAFRADWKIFILEKKKRLTPEKSLIYVDYELALTKTQHYSIVDGWEHLVKTSTFIMRLRLISREKSTFLIFSRVQNKQWLSVLNGSMSFGQKYENITAMQEERPKWN